MSANDSPVSDFIVMRLFHINLYSQGGPGELPFGWTEPLRQQTVLFRVYAGEKKTFCKESEEISLHVFANMFLGLLFHMKGRISGI